MNDCPNGDVRDLLPDLLHDRLAPAARWDVEEHVRGCADCREELALLRTMSASLRRAPAMDAARIAAAIPAYRAPARRSWGGWRAAAAIVVLAAGGTSVAVLQRGEPAGSDSTAVVVVGEVPTAVGAVPLAPESPAVVSGGAPRELAIASSSVGELDDSELSALIADLQSVEMLPSADVENGTAVSPMPPTGTN
jgi:hypothetical protein